MDRKGPKDETVQTMEHNRPQGKTGHTHSHLHLHTHTHAHTHKHTHTWTSMIMVTGSTSTCHRATSRDGIHPVMSLLKYRVKKWWSAQYQSLRGRRRRRQGTRFKEEHSLLHTGKQRRKQRKCTVLCNRVEGNALCSATE